MNRAADTGDNVGVLKVDIGEGGTAGGRGCAAERGLRRGEAAGGWKAGTGAGVAAELVEPRALPPERRTEEARGVEADGEGVAAWVVG